MRKWLLLCCLLSFAALAQKKKSDFLGYRVHDMERFLVEEFAKREKGIMDSFAIRMLKPSVKTIYLVKTNYYKDLPQKANGYAIKLINADSAAKFLYREQEKDSSVLLYLTDGMQFYQKFTIWAMPVHIQKNGRKYIPVFDTKSGVMTTFNFLESTTTFTLDSIKYIRPTP